ncbi:FGGY family carbohydrate kinase [Nocardioides cynanchi]|uniref:FGGY family carbohydrate kinase n=1 Tax=Nocardioides cynanchi TaxID=2558918 RepID=UPI001243B17C|nr:FGGY family carbohydrate kinase [Nocardioides cynanchi]
MTCVLAVDQGTSGTKAIVVDETGAILALAEVALEPRYLAGGGVEQDPEALYDSVVLAGRRAVAEAGVPVAAVALANQGETVLAWDRATGRPLSAAVVWQDRRAEAWCRAHREHGPRVGELTGLVLDPYFSAPKLRWLRDHVTTDGVVTTTDTWLVHRLCGAFVTDLSTASRSLVLDLDDTTWSGELLSLFGLDAEPLPELVACDEVVGTTRAFGGEVPVAGLVVDQQAALLAERCLEPGTAKCTFGTGAFLLAQLGEEAVRSSAGLTTSVAWRLRGRTSYCADGQVYTAASAVRWAVELGLVSSPDELDTVAAGSSDGVLCVPALAGLAAPWWDASATASFTGMTLSSGRGHLVRALLEGVAAQVATLTSLVADDLGRPLSRLRVDGGLTRSRTLMQAQADLAQLPVELYPSAHATPLGAAACARLALEPGLSIEDAVPTWRAAEVFEPVWSADRADDHLSRWRAAALVGTTPDGSS